ncbi:MAG: hypothetical protein H6791_02240 [Candidatus Nomurabacteria bacterium]|nr:MAG: hypothetical protein H6791_02240 [Candidatus Nomurabacteria bacterium]
MEDISISQNPEMGRPGRNGVEELDMVPDDVKEDYEMNHNNTSTEITEPIDNSWESYGEDLEEDMDNFEKRCMEEFGTIDPKVISEKIGQEFEVYLANEYSYSGELSSEGLQEDKFEEFESLMDENTKTAVYPSRYDKRSSVSAYLGFLEKKHPEIFELYKKVISDKKTSIKSKVPENTDRIWGETLKQAFRVYEKGLDPSKINSFLEENL